MKRFTPDLFLTGMVAAIVAAALFPAPGAAGGWLHPNLLTKAGIALVFFLNGGLMSFGALKDGVARWRLHLIIQGATFVLFPIIGLAFLAIAGRWTTPDLRLGLFYLCAMPSTVSSSVAMTAAARGNVPVAVFNATLSSLIGIVITPLWMSLLLGSMGGHLDMAGVVIDLTIWLVAPLALGQAMRPLIGAWLGRHRKLAQVADRGVILILVYTSFCDSFARHVWSGHAPATLLTAIVAAIVLFFLVLGLLWSLCDRFGIPPAFRSAVVFCGTKKSLATGVPMAHLIFAAMPGSLGVILLPIMIYHPFQLLMCAPLAAKWAKLTEENAVTD